MERQENTMNRRRFLSLTAGATALSIGLAHPASHQALARQEADLASLGLPELTVTQTDEGYAVSPATTPAGWTLLTFENQLSSGDSSADVMLIPEGETLDSLFASISPDPTAPPPAWVFEATLVGAPWAPSGGSARALIHLSEGEWVAFSPAPGAPATFTVTASDAAANAPEVAIDAEVTMQDMAFLGLDEPLAAGPQVWKIANVGPQPHLMSFSPVPPGTTQDQFFEMMVGSMSATPTGEPAGDVPPTTGGTATLSNGQEIYLALDLAAGTYGAVCFFSDQETGAPHAMLGMVQVFTVA
jgi:hypothetical protein